MMDQQQMEGTMMQEPYQTEEQTDSGRGMAPAGDQMSGMRESDSMHEQTEIDEDQMSDDGMAGMGT
jgi:hypothetical protein